VCLGSLFALTGILARWFARDGNVWIRSQETALSCLLVPRCLHPCLLSLKGSRKLLDIDDAALYRIPIFLSFFTVHVYRKTVIILGGCLIYYLLFNITIIFISNFLIKLHFLLEVKEKKIYYFFNIFYPLCCILKYFNKNSASFIKNPSETGVCLNQSNGNRI
jgi:hypothetical protein